MAIDRDELMRLADILRVNIEGPIGADEEEGDPGFICLGVDDAKLIEHAFRTLAQRAPQHGAVPEGWTEDRLRAEAKARGWYIREGTSVPTADGNWRHPFEITIPSRDLCALLAAAPAPEAAKCACGLSTCVEPWEPGCGLGNSEEFVVAAPEAERAEGDWPEDASHENGDYECKCASCGQLFVGHKRRVTCKACSQPPAGQPEGVEATFGAFYTCPTCLGVGVTTKAVHDELRRLASAQRAEEIKPEELTPHAIRAFKSCVRDLRDMADNARDYGLDEGQVGALETAIESIELRAGKDGA